MTLEEKYTEMMERFKKDALAAVNVSIDRIHCDIAPHLDSDTDSNVCFQTSEVVTSILRGGFTRVDENTVEAHGYSGVSVRVNMTDLQYDNIRKTLLAAMPACPKDLEIQSLKDQLKRAWERY